jgi:hypothetical protein
VKILKNKQILGVYEPVPVGLKALIWRNFGEIKISTYHWISLTIHLLNVLLLKLAVLPGLLRRMGRLPRTSSVVIGTSLFAIHPMNVEVVTWASCIPYLLAGFFSLLSFWCYLLSVPLMCDTWGAISEDGVNSKKKRKIAAKIKNRHTKWLSPLRDVWAAVKKD